MAYRVNNVEDLPPTIRAQVEAKLEKQKKSKSRRQSIKMSAGEFESKGERDFYYAEIYPKLQSGAIIECETHKTFELLPKSEYCGLRLPSAKYTPDFFITYRNGHKEAIEIKHKVIRKLQRDYIYRRRLFIEIHARPNGWSFREILNESEGK